MIVSAENSTMSNSDYYKDYTGTDTPTSPRQTK
jgi:hypothetical protein